MCPGTAATYRVRQENHKLYIRLDNNFIYGSESSLTKGLLVHIVCDVTNTDRALGTSLSYRVSELYGEEGLSKNTFARKVQQGNLMVPSLLLAPPLNLKVMSMILLTRAFPKIVSSSILPNLRFSRQKKTSLLAMFVCTVPLQEKLLFVVLPPSSSLFSLFWPQYCC